VFKEIITSFFIVGHTHNDVDQLFSRVSVHLHTTNAITNEDFIDVVRDSVNNILLDYDFIENVPNISELMLSSNWLNDMTGFNYVFD
jgi:hypothetical protein